MSKKDTIQKTKFRGLMRTELGATNETLAIKLGCKTNKVEYFIHKLNTIPEKVTTKELEYYAKPFNLTGFDLYRKIFT